MSSPGSIREIEPVVAELLRHLRGRFGERLKAVVVYGSYARGTAEPGSDIDLVVVVSGLPYEWRDLFAIEDELSVMGLELGRRLDIRLVEPEAVSGAVSGPSPLMLEIHDAHRVLLDTESFFAAGMTRLAEGMKRRGIRKLRPGVWKVPEVAQQ